MQKISKKHPCRVNTIQTDCVITLFFERKKGVLVDEGKMNKKNRPER